MSIEEQNQTADAAAPEITFDQLRDMALKLAERNNELCGVIITILLTVGPRIELLRELEPEIEKHGFTVSWLEDGKGVAVELVKMSELAIEPDEVTTPAEEVNEPA